MVLNWKSFLIPDHWSSSLKYWWTGIGMISITIFIIYNIIFAFALIPPENLQANRVRTSSKKIEHNFKRTSFLPEVFMHILVNTNEEVDLNKYLPYIESISNEHFEFKYNLIIVLNDMLTEANSLSAEETNEIAFNSLWAKKEQIEKNQKMIKNNINIEYVMLSKYVHESPIRKHWRELPRHYIEFLIRAVSIWEKGGIALNPIVLTPQSPHVIYKEKLLNILKRYGKCNTHRLHEVKPKKNQQQKQIHHKEKKKIKVNNIRDIIENLERDDGSSNSSQANLTEVETKMDPVIVQRQLLSVTKQLNTTETNKEQLNDILIHPNFYSYVKDNETNSFDVKEQSKSEFKEIMKDKSVYDIDLISDKLDSNKTSLSLLPLFLDFLFHDKSKTINHLPKNNAEDEIKHNITRQRKSVIPVENKNYISFGFPNKSESKITDKYDPIIISAKNIIADEQRKINETNNISNRNDMHDHVELTLDLEGNIMATETPCHAFLGTVFSNVIHHTEEETLKDFIITELSIFCKGLLSSCKGIDVILL